MPSAMPARSNDPPPELDQFMRIGPGPQVLQATPQDLLDEPGPAREIAAERIPAPTTAAEQPSLNVIQLKQARPLVEIPAKIQGGAREEIVELLETIILARQIGERREE